MGSVISLRPMRNVIRWVQLVKLSTTDAVINLHSFTLLNSNQHSSLLTYSRNNKAKRGWYLSLLWNHPNSKMSQGDYQNVTQNQNPTL